MTDVIHLQTIPDAPLPLSYTQLMKQVGRIRRPYYAQAVAVISLCRFLARHYECLTNDQRTATNLEPLEECVVDPLEETTLQLSLLFDQSLWGNPLRIAGRRDLSPDVEKFRHECARKCARK